MTGAMTSSPHPAGLGSELGEGARIGSCVVDLWIRDGGMGALYLGHHPVTGAKVAIKVLTTRYRADPEVTARFDREAEVMGRLAGAAQVVHIHDAGVDPHGRRVLVMEWVEGENLEERIDAMIASKAALADEVLSADGASRLTEMNDDELLATVRLDLRSAVGGA